MPIIHVIDSRAKKVDDGGRLAYTLGAQAGVEKRNTQCTQNASLARACGFESHLRHQRPGKYTWSLSFLGPTSTIAGMRSYEEHRLILDLWEQGKKKKRIALMTGIPRGTVQSCIKRYHNIEGLAEIWAAQSDLPDSLRTLKKGPDEGKEDLFHEYAYLFGLYLGDGCVSRSRRTYRLRVALDTHYPNIIHNCVQAIRALLPLNIVNTVEHAGDNFLEVSCYSNHWPVLFPQHGAGPKHLRSIILEPWQQAIVETYPIPFLRGLIHSDGCRSTNIVKGKDYPRYEFSNMSADIKRIFCSICDQLEIHWRTATGGRNIQIARRKDVEYLDRFIGPKS